MAPSSPLLSIENLSVSFAVPGGRVRATDKVSFDLHRGETLGIVGESGSGKSVAAYSIVGLLARNGRVDSGRILFEGRDLLADPGAARSVRGRNIAFIFQNPRAALNPIRSVGAQIQDVVSATALARLTRRQARERAIELLELVRIDRAGERFEAFPHQLSGGMCQRILIAMALAADPDILIADEPTTGLDVTTQRIIMDTLSTLAQERGLATMLITHDLGLAARYCSRLAVMNRGALVEQGLAADVLANPRDAYTQRLVAATPRSGGTLTDLLPADERAPYLESVTVPGGAPGERLLAVEGLRKTFAAPRPGLLRRLRESFRAGEKEDPVPPEIPGIHAVREVSLTLARGEALGIVGESGSGKTTVSRMIARLLDASSGSIIFRGQEIGTEPAADFARSPLRPRLQVVFQDPLGSLNPRFTAYEAIRNPLLRCRKEPLAAETVDALIRTAAARAGLSETLLSRFPHQLSGGQQARVGIARALVVEPEVLILDEPTSALDVSVQALVLNQLAKLRAELGLSFIFVSHDLNVVRLLCDQVIVMRRGRVVEAGAAADVLSNPQDPYTRELVEAIPHLDLVSPSLACHDS